MAIAFVQTGAANGSASANPSTAAFTSTTGNLLVVVIANDSGGDNYITSVTDSKGNTYTKVIDSLHNGGSGSCGLWYCANITGGASHTVSIGFSLSGASNVGWVVQEYSGIDTSTPKDVHTAIASGSSTTPLSSTSSSTTLADELVVVAVGHATTTTTATAGAGYTNLAKGGSAVSGGAWAVQESKIVSATGTQAGGCTLGASRAWGAFVCTFKSGAAPTPGPTTNPVAAAQSPAVARASRW